MKRILAALAVAALTSFPLCGADAAFVAGWLAQCTASTATSCTENSGGSYARQPVSFNLVAGPRAALASNYSFGGAAGTITAHALYDAATGGNIIAVIPLAAALTTPPPDVGSAGGINFSLAGVASGTPFDAINTNYAAGATIGVSADGSTVTAGVLDFIYRGEMKNGCPVYSGTGTPLGAVVAPVCSTYLRLDGGTTTTLYVKESGAGANTGWVAK